MPKRRYARTPSELRKGIERFDADLRHITRASPTAQHDVREFMRRSRAIYAVPKGSGFLVCGGKFCGYFDLDVETYSRERTLLNGGHAHAHIRGWADEVSRDHPAHKAWEVLCTTLGVQPAPSYQTFLVRTDTARPDATIPPLEDKMVDLIVQLTVMLTHASRDNLKRRIAAL